MTTSDSSPMPTSTDEPTDSPSYTVVHGIKCPKCEAEVWSRHGHDCRSCPCGYCYVDGGRSYTRIGYGGAEWPEPWSPPETVDIEVCI